MDVVIGNMMYMTKLGIDAKPYVKKLEELQEQAKTVVFLLINNKPTALIAMADALKPFAKEAIAELVRMKKAFLAQPRPRAPSLAPSPLVRFRRAARAVEALHQRLEHVEGQSLGPVREGGLGVRVNLHHDSMRTA